MKTRTWLMMSVAVLAVALVWWRNTRPPVSPAGYANPYLLQVQVAGTVGAPITGRLVRNGQTIPIAGTVPWNLAESNVTLLEIRKTRPEDSLTLEARGGGSMVSGSASGNVQGMRVEMEGGWSFHTIP